MSTVNNDVLSAVFRPLQAQKEPERRHRIIPVGAPRERVQSQISSGCDRCRARRVQRMARYVLWVSREQERGSTTRILDLLACFHGARVEVPVSISCGWRPTCIVQGLTPFILSMLLISYRFTSTTCDDFARCKRENASLRVRPFTLLTRLDVSRHSYKILGPFFPSHTISCVDALY